TTKKTTYTELREVAVVVAKGSQLLVRQCGPEERWAGLWDFPRFGIEAEGPLFAESEIAQKLHAQTGIHARVGEQLTTIKHGVTRYRITLEVLRGRFQSGRLRRTPDAPLRWIAPSELAELPLSTTGRKIARLL